MSSPGDHEEEIDMYDVTFAKANDDYRREVLTRSWTHHRNLIRTLLKK